MPTTPAAVARRLWASATPDDTPPEELAAAVDRICSHLRTGLGRWIGAEGYHSLLDQSLGRVRSTHAVLRSIGCMGNEQTAILAAIQRHGSGVVMAAMVDLVAMLVELLGQIIGEEMAVRLVEQAGLPSSRAGVGSGSDGGQRG